MNRFRDLDDAILALAKELSLGAMLRYRGARVTPSGDFKAVYAPETVGEQEARACMAGLIEEREKLRWREHERWLAQSEA